MMEHVNGFKAAVAAIFGALTALWGWFGWLLVGWLVLMALDVATGMAAAAKVGDWKSSEARDGLWHKAGSIVTVILAGVMDLMLGYVLPNIGGFSWPFEYSVLFCPVVVVWYVVTEAGSIVENAGKLGAPVPGWLKKAIASLRDKMDDIQDPDPQ